MKLIVKKGATSYLATVFIQNNSVTTGAGLTGLTSGSSGLICYRARSDDGNAGGTAITLSAGTRGTWSSGGFVEKDSTNMPGVYEIGIPNAAIASGSDYAIVMLSGATNMAPAVMEFQLVGFDPDDGTHLGLSCLPNTAVTTNASLITSGSGTDQLTVSGGIASADAKKINAVTLAAQALAQSTQSICWGTCSGGTTATAVVSTLNNPSSLTDSGQLIGRTIIFLGNTTTTDIQSQASNITASTTGATPTITFTAMTHAPANGDVFVVL